MQELHGLSLREDVHAVSEPDGGGYLGSPCDLFVSDGLASCQTGVLEEFEAVPAVVGADLIDRVLS